jgi:hypothetical protein
MLSFGLGLGLRSSALYNKSSDVIVSRLTHRVYGIGSSGETTVLTGDGTAKTYSASFVNNSGTPITTASVLLQGWGLTTTGTVNCGNASVITGTVEYPVGTTTTAIVSGGDPNNTVPDGLFLQTDGVALPTAIPDGATFKVNLSTTPANGVKYMIRLGFAGVLSTAKKSLFNKEVLYAIGDSIATNNGGAVYNTALGKCAAYCATIGGTTAQTYGASSAANFTKQVALAKALGATRFMSNFGTNDFLASRTQSQLQTDLLAMKTLANANGMLFTQWTMLPRTGVIAAISTTLTSSGTSITASVPDASLFTVGKPYAIAGATQSEYNGSKICLSVDTGNNTVTLLFAGSGTTPATGTITINQWKQTYSVPFMVPLSASYAAGSSSPRGQFNANIRGGMFDGYVECADAFEPSRDSGRWLVGGESTYLPDVELVTVSSVISTARFNSNYSRGSNTVPNGFVQPLTGANAGTAKTGNGNTNGDITVSSAWTNTQVVGDQYYVVPGVSYISDDGTHPRVAAGGKGGQAILDKQVGDFITSIL